MKKITLRIMAAIMAAVLLMPVIAGCNRNKNNEDPNNAAETPEFVFVPEYYSLPSDFTYIYYMTILGEKLVFASQFMDEENRSYNTTKLFSMNFDGTGITELSNYRLDEMPEDVMGYESVSGLFTDTQGNLWVAEVGHYYYYDLPEDFDEESGDMREMYEYYTDLGSKTTVRKLDGTGAELLSVDLSSLSNNSESFYLRAINIDSEGNIYIADDSSIMILDSGGRVQFRLEVTGWIDQLIRLADGSVAFSGYNENSGRGLRAIDIAARGWGESVELPFNAYQFFPGGGDYSLLYHDGSALYGLDESTGESEKLLNWIDSDILTDGLGNITLLPDGRVLCTSQTWDNTTGVTRYELIILTKVPFDSLPPRTTITLAAMWLDWSIRSAIVNFNKTNANYRIQATDYAEFNTEDDYQAGITRLSTEIISGNIPDILLTSNLPFEQYVAKGLFEDLYPYIDSDPNLNRSDLFETILRATEINGGLYQIFPNFSINTMVGHPSVLGRDMGWNMDEFIATLRANPQATSPMGPYMTKSSFLQSFISINLGEYVDWSAGTVSFDTGDFAQLLEYANTFPEEIDWDSPGFDRVSEFDLISSGQQILMSFWVSDFRSPQMYKALFGGDLVFKGYPTKNRDGNILTIGAGIAMTAGCKNKEAAWSFMRTILTEDWQRTNMRWNFPTNRAVFNEIMEEAMTPQTYIDEEGNEIEYSTMSWGMEGLTIEIFALTQAEADMVLALINSASGISGNDESLMNIIMDGANDFFSGRSSAQDTTRVIQSRASIYIAEQS